MKAAVLSVKIASSDEIQKVRSELENWKGLPQGGVKQIITIDESGNNNRFVVVVLFEDESVLKSFSDDSGVLQLFDDLKPIFKGLVQHYGANVSVKNF